MKLSDPQGRPEHDRFLKLKEVGAMIRRDQKTVRRYISKGLLPSPHRIGRSLMLLESEVHSAVEKLRVHPMEGCS